MIDKIKIYYDYFQAFLITSLTAIMAYFDSTATFMSALMLAFTFNILAGMRADEVKIKIKRLYPPRMSNYFQNFNGNKLKDSLFEFFLIVFLIYLLKVIAEFMKIEIHLPDGGVYVVQYLTWIALYYYLRNGLRNLKTAYPKNKFIKIIYVILSFKFKKFLGDDLKKEIEKIEKDE